jgi:RNA polymerase sigma-70 factor, ECF subfamily
MSKKQQHAPVDSGAATGASSEGFDRLYRDHVDVLSRFAQRMCGRTEDAKDVVQETFLNAYRGLKAFRGDAQLSTWLYTIASRVSHRMRRKRTGEPARELSLEEFAPSLESESRLQIPTGGPTPEEALENKQLRKVLRRAIEKLPHKYRVILVLRDVEGFTAKEVGAMVSLNERAVKTRLHRARLFLRRELNASLYAGVDTADRDLLA